MAEVSKQGRHVPYGTEGKTQWAYIYDRSPANHPKFKERDTIGTPKEHEAQWEPVEGYTAVDEYGVEYPTKYRRISRSGREWNVDPNKLRYGDYYYNTKDGRTPEQIEKDYKLDQQYSNRRQDTKNRAYSARKQIKELEAYNEKMRTLIKELRDVLENKNPKFPVAEPDGTVTAQYYPRIVEVRNRINQANYTIQQNLLKINEITKQTWGYEPEAPPPYEERIRRRNVSPERYPEVKPKHPYAFKQYGQSLRKV